MITKTHFDCMFAARLASLREMRGMTQEDVAKASGLKPAAVSHFETARRRPCLANLVKLCAALRCTPNDLLCPPNDLAVTRGASAPPSPAKE